jgi:hypothetical protein
MSDWKVGQLVRISRVTPPMRQPHPEHEGKIGYITATEAVSMGGDDTFDVPVITLEDGVVLKGYDCWWEPVKAN